MLMRSWIRFFILIFTLGSLSPSVLAEEPASIETIIQKQLGLRQIRERSPKPQPLTEVQKLQDCIRQIALSTSKSNITPVHNEHWMRDFVTYAKLGDQKGLLLVYRGETFFYRLDSVPLLERLAGESGIKLPTPDDSLFVNLARGELQYAGIFPRINWTEESYVHQLSPTRLLPEVEKAVLKQIALAKFEKFAKMHTERSAEICGAALQQQSGVNLTAKDPAVDEGDQRKQPQMPLPSNEEFDSSSMLATPAL